VSKFFKKIDTSLPYVDAMDIWPRNEQKIAKFTHILWIWVNPEHMLHRIDPNDFRRLKAGWEEK
jgi:hypothetical protein